MAKTKCKVDFLPVHMLSELLERFLLWLAEAMDDLIREPNEMMDLIEVCMSKLKCKLRKMTWKPLLIIGM